MIQLAGHAHSPDAPALSQALAAAPPGQQVTLTLTLTRDTQDLTVAVTPGELPGR